VGARATLARVERERFLSEEWPKIRATIERLEIAPDELLQAATAPKNKSHDTEKR
jgi:GntR family transcriptional regulator